MVLGLTACGNDARQTPAADTETNSAASEAAAEESEAEGTETAEPSEEAPDEDMTQEPGGGNVLVAYFAYSENIGDTSGMDVDAVTSASLNRSTSNTEGNLQVMAQEIQEKRGADIFHILVEEPYDPSYDVMHDRAIDEISDGARPVLLERVENLDQYDVVYLGTPVWSGSMPPALFTFLDENDLSGKTVIPFGINLGSGFGRIPDQLKEQCPDANILDGFTISASTGNAEVREQVGEWLDGLNY